MQVKLLLVTFYLNDGLHAVSIGKPSERMSNFWMVWFLKTESKPNFGFPHIPSRQPSQWIDAITITRFCAAQRYELLRDAAVRL